MSKTYRIELNGLDLGQLLDGLDMRATAWERTAEYYRGEESSDDFLIEECNGEHEAQSIAAHYRAIITSIREQMEAQS